MPFALCITATIVKGALSKLPQSQPDIRAGKRALRQNNEHIDDLQRVWRVVQIPDMRRSADVGRNDEVTRLERRRDELCRQAVFDRRSKDDIDNRCERSPFGQHDPRDIVTMDLSQGVNNRRDIVRVSETLRH